MTTPGATRARGGPAGAATRGGVASRCGGLTAIIGAPGGGGAFRGRLAPFISASAPLGRGTGRTVIGIPGGPRGGACRGPAQGGGGGRHGAYRPVIVFAPPSLHAIMPDPARRALSAAEGGPRPCGATVSLAGRGASRGISRPSACTFGPSKGVAAPVTAFRIGAIKLRRPAPPAGRAGASRHRARRGGARPLPSTRHCTTRRRGPTRPHRFSGGVAGTTGSGCASLATPYRPGLARPMAAAQGTFIPCIIIGTASCRRPGPALRA